MPDQQHDFILELLNTMVNAQPGGMTLGVTLQLGGFLVTGQLCSGKEFIEALSDDLVSATETKLPGELPEALRGLKELAAKFYGKDGSKEPEHVHMKAVRIFSGTGTPLGGSKGFDWWRGRLRDVSAVIPGELR